MKSEKNTSFSTFIRTTAIIIGKNNLYFSTTLFEKRISPPRSPMSQAYKQETKGREGRQEGAWDVRLFGIPFGQKHSVFKPRHKKE